VATWNDIINNVGDELALDTFKVGGGDVAHTQRALNRTLQNMFSSSRHAFSWRVIETPLTVTSVVNQTDYDLSTVTGGVKFLDLHSAVMDDGTSATRPLVEKTLKWYIRHFANVGTIGSGTPIYYTRVGLYTVRVAPKPSSVTQLLKFYYTLEPQEITVFTATVDIPERALEVLELGILSRLYRFLHESERHIALQNDYKRELVNLVKEDKNNPNLSFVMQPFNTGGHGATTEYWKNPFVG